MRKVGGDLIPRIVAGVKETLLSQEAEVEVTPQACPPSAMTGVGFVKVFLHVDSLEGRDWVIPACLVPGTSGGRADITSTINVKG